MKAYLSFIFKLSGLLFLFVSCEDEIQPSLLVRAEHDGHALGQATVYLEAGLHVDPDLPLDQYDLKQRADGQGDAYFSNLLNISYTILVVGYDPLENRRKVQGRQVVSLNASTRNKTTVVTIETVNIEPE